MTTTTPRILAFTAELPPLELSPNRAKGRHWTSTSSYRDSYRTLVYTAALEAWYPAYGTRAEPMQHARLSLRFVWCGGQRALDLDNSIGAFKAGQDGLVRAGVVVNDSWLHLSYGSVSAGRCKPRCTCGGRVEITVEEVSA